MYKNRIRSDAEIMATNKGNAQYRQKQTTYGSQIRQFHQDSCIHANHNAVKVQYMFHLHISIDQMNNLQPQEVVEPRLAEVALLLEQLIIFVYCRDCQTAIT